MARSYGCNNRDWDPMQEDYNNSNYESQYPDDNSSDGVKLDHCRLYIRNIPVGLTDSGLESVFEKFGTLTEVFLSKDPDKRYGIVAFERPAEARHAMASLNKTEPLGLLINIAHERKVKGVSQNRNPEHGTRERESYSTRERENNSNRERQSSAVSKRSNRERDESSNSNRWQNNANRKTDNMATGDNLVPLEDIQADLGDDLSIDTMDPDLLLELERLEIERLKLQQAQLACKQRMLIKQAKRGQTVTVSVFDNVSLCVEIERLKLQQAQLACKQRMLIKQAKRGQTVTVSAAFDNVSLCVEIERLKLQQAQLACKQRMLIKQAKRGQTVTIERLKLQQAQLACKQRMLIKQAKRGQTVTVSVFDNVSLCVEIEHLKLQQAQLACKQRMLIKQAKRGQTVTVSVFDNVSLCVEIERLKLQQAQLACKQRMLIKQAKRGQTVTQAQVQPQSASRCVLPDGKIMLRNTPDNSNQNRDVDGSFSAGAGDSNKRIDVPTHEWEGVAHSDDECSTPSTAKITERTFGPNYKAKSDKSIERTTAALSTKSINSKTTDLTSKKSECSRKKSATKKTSKYLSDETCELKYGDFFSDSDNEMDETNRLIQLRNTDYTGVVDNQLKIVVALAGYPKSKMRLQQMGIFQRCMSEIMDMQLKAGLLKVTPSFLDYYLNRGAIVCICKDFDTRDWMVRVSPGLQERMNINLILLKSKLKRLCRAVLKVPSSSWPATAQETFKLIQYFNPAIKTDKWNIYAQKTVDGVEITSFLTDRVSGEILRGPLFKNVIDYNEIEFEILGFTEIYYECLLSDLEEDLSSVASRVKLLEEIKSENNTPREQSATETRVQSTVNLESKNHEQTEQDIVNIEQAAFESSLQEDVIKKLKDIQYIRDKEEIMWSDEANFSDQELQTTKKDADVYVNDETIKMYTNEVYGDEENKMYSHSGVAMSEKTESIFESNDNLTVSRNSNLNIDTNRGIAYHRRTNYLHIENELKVAITLEGYPQDKLEGTHIRRLKHLFKEYLHRDMKNQRFSNLIIPKFTDIYLSNGAVIYICDSLETKDYLSEVLPKFVNSTGLKLTFRDIKNLVRYTRVVMRLPKEHAHVETLEILLKLQAVYPGLKPSCWKYYSDVAGKQKRQFGVDPESLEVIKSPDFDPTYQGDKLIFRIIDRQKRDVSFEEPTNTDMNNKNFEAKQIREVRYKNIYEPIDPEILNAPLTKIRTNHYSDLIADDLKLYIGPSCYPESRVDEHLFNLIKRTLEHVVMDSLQRGDLTEDAIPKFHDMYLFDGVIFVICLNMYSRYWIEENLAIVNRELHINLKATEFRGAVGIISLVVRTDKDIDDVISILQTQNSRLRTKFWRKISLVRTKTKLDAVLQIDKLSALVMSSPGFNKYIEGNPIQFKLGHLQSMLNPSASLEELKKQQETLKSSKSVKPTRSKLSMHGPKGKTYEELMRELRKEYPSLKVDEWNVIAQHEKHTHQICDLEIDEASAKLIEKQGFKLSVAHEKLCFYSGKLSHRSAIDSHRSANDSHRSAVESHRSADDSPAIEPDSARTVATVDTNPLPAEIDQDLRKIILKIPMNILPDNREDLNIIFDLLEDKNPGLNTELWQVYTDAPYPNNGKFTIIMDRQSASIIEGKHFVPTVGGEQLKFYF
ncbi:RNA recognition motif domain-containing protein [Phthorimaea operculella]|nr:RNA recognition motif domain-containing protein [Phthorimaea operculella]